MEARGRDRSTLNLLVILLAVGASLLGAALLQDGGANGGQGSGAGDRASDEELTKLAVRLEPAVARRVELIRRLSFDSVPRPRIVDAEHLNDLNAEELERPRVRADIAAGDSEATLLGLIEDGDDLSAIAADSGDLAAAAYDPRTDQLFVISDAVSSSPALIEFVLAHELTHALEDQRFGLRVRPDLADDRALAGMALTEGTATALMTDYATKFLNVVELGAGAASIDPGTEGIPQFILDQLNFAYLGGSAFVEALYGRTDSWLLVDRALRSQPPVSSEQILHPVKYLIDERPVSVDITSRNPGPGWERKDTGTIGEFSTSRIIALGSDEATAAPAAAGWGGDSYALWGRAADSDAGCADLSACREDHTLVVQWAWDNPRDAEEMAAALPRYLRDALGGEASGEAWQLPDGGAAYATRGDQVTLVLAPTPEMASRLAG